jgi:hypothetical protein
VLEFTEVIMLLLFLHKIETRYLDLSKSGKKSIGMFHPQAIDPK